MFNERCGAAMDDLALFVFDTVLESMRTFPIADSDGVREGVCEITKQLRTAVAAGVFVPDAVQLTMLHGWTGLCIHELRENSYVPDNLRQQLRSRLLQLHSIKRRELERLKGDAHYYSELCLKVADVLCVCEKNLYLQKMCNERVN